MAAFKESFAEFLSFVTIDSKDTGGGTALADHIYYAQERFLGATWDALSRDIHDIKCLKSRQLGISTICKPLVLFWMGVHDGLEGAMIFDTDAHKEAARRDIETMIDEIHENHPDYDFPGIKQRNRYGLLLDNRSFLHFMAAGVKNTRSSGVLGRSSGLSLVWGSEVCLAPGTLITLDDGKVKPIEMANEQERVITHTGAKARIVGVLARENTKDMIEITPFFGPAVCCTYNHKIVTGRGLVEAGQIREDDRLALPVRKITEEQTHILLPPHKPHPIYGGAVAIAAGQEVRLSEEFGFAVGYYLAEGCIIYTSGPSGKYHYRSGIQFTRHEAEAFYANRAIAALSPYLTNNRRTARGNGKAYYDSIMGAALASWMEDTFGSFRRTKRIPDEVFSWGVDFCRGLLTGLLCGDGSKTGLRRKRSHNNVVCLASVYQSLAFQARDLACALQLAWGGARFRAGGTRNDRRCKELWTIEWSGRGAEKLRALMGLPKLPTRKYKPDSYELYDDRLLVKIRRIERDLPPCPRVYDLVLDHPDHTYRTIGISVANCSWENVEGLVSLRSSISHINPNRLYLWESTARGPNEWEKMWQEAKKDDLNQATVFIGWWARLDQRWARGTRQFERYGAEPATDEERQRIAEVKRLYDFDVDQEQLAWYRYFEDPTQDEEGGAPTQEEGLVQQDQPWTEFEAFILTGSSFFDTVKLTEIHNSTVTNRYQAFRFLPGTNFLTSTIIPARTWREVELRIWETPVPDASYIVGCDSAFGHSEKNDRSAVEVFRAYADGMDQVAEFVSGSIQPDHLAWMVWTLVGYYGSFSGRPVMPIIELNGPGEAVWKEMQAVQQIITNGYLRNAAAERGIADIHRNCRQYIWQRSDSLTHGSAFHIKTTEQIKVAIMERLRVNIHGGLFVIRSAELVDEFRIITRDGDKIEAEGRGHDDRAMAAAFCGRAWDDRVRRGLVMQNKTRQAEKARLAMAAGDQMALYQQYHLTNFFRVKQTVRQSAALTQLRQERRRDIGRRY